MEPKAPTPVQVAALVTAAFAKGADWGTVWLLLVTGARRAEIARCQMKHVGFERSRIFIDPTKVRGTSWWLALDSATMEPLEASSRDRIADRLGTLGQTPTGEEYLYSYQPDHALHGSLGYLSKRLKSMGQSIGIDTHTHALRHYAATELIVGSTSSPSRTASATSVLRPLPISMLPGGPTSIVVPLPCSPAA
ncbi:site-specific integrase [Glycomyces mayteni]|uniref:Site-specific integrase n=1 Tax=Glycomyces mayteni TaxID=543887 RepID=A0ABW2D5D2_9ACTN